MRKKEVIHFFGGTNATAKAIGVSRSTVSLWKEIIPWKYAFFIERLTNHSLKYNPVFYTPLEKLLADTKNSIFKS
ncbi:Cro/CI family transcriptional regulator [Candidatus Williamhamiltonella defendens]|uniref:Uncharacterized protein n=1 Tax=Candidatus Hamiltonella defensa (Bemisia tabaci) TaxID=672795 RepID=A0A249DYJ5_9ENTR|nr:Cro/CI family transcriptional regulator [Candidatus Hamiltonella defensa]ASX25977.1 hypothetical protein BA171_02245 [Candidatus Hamiltonella defensa (Bemisia tabaci)]